MGSHHQDAGRGRDRALTSTAQVVPELATFAVDDGFSYEIPEALAGVRIGSIVRVPLGGRRIRGFVVAVRDDIRPSRPLKQIVGVSGDLPIYDARHLETLRWAAMHYVAPMAALLPRAAPPNLPRMKEPRPESRESRPPPPGGFEDSPVPDATAAAAAGKRIRPQYLVTRRLTADRLVAAAGPVLAAGRTVMVVAPTVAEAEELYDAMARRLGARAALVTSALSARRQTSMWVRSRTSPGRLVVGTREIAFWPMEGLAMAVVIEEGRRGMKAKQTPTVHVRDLLRRRAAVERFQLVFSGPVPTTEAVAAAVDVRQGAGRVWPPVEIVDRTEEPPGTGPVTERVRRALAMAVSGGRTGFVLVHRRGYAPAFRCVRCGTVRRCRVCGAAADRGDSCRRCTASLGSCSECGGGRFEPLGSGVGRIVDDLARTLGDSVGPADGPSRPVLVGTERDLPLIPDVDLAVALDIDGLMLAPNYRAAEDALRVAARTAGKVHRGSGNRAMAQTALPEHPVVAALRSGHPMPFLQEELRLRGEQGFPPTGELIAIDVGNVPDDADTDLRRTVAADVHGPAEAGEATRWLVQGPDLREAKIRLRGLVQTWRDAGARVRVDVDPIDL